MYKSTKELKEELEELKRKNIENKERKTLSTQIFIQKHQTLIGIGEKVRSGMGALSEKAKKSWNKMKEKELIDKKKIISHPKESYSEHLNKVLANLAK